MGGTTKKYCLEYSTVFKVTGERIAHFSVKLHHLCQPHSHIPWSIKLAANMSFHSVNFVVYFHPHHQGFIWKISQGGGGGENRFSKIGGGGGGRRIRRCINAQ